jgi:hypothetical protein
MQQIIKLFVGAVILFLGLIAVIAVLNANPSPWASTQSRADVFPAAAVKTLQGYDLQGPVTLPIILESLKAQTTSLPLAERQANPRQDMSSPGMEETPARPGSWEPFFRKAQSGVALGDDLQPALIIVPISAKKFALQAEASAAGAEAAARNAEVAVADSLAGADKAEAASDRAEAAAAKAEALLMK